MERARGEGRGKGLWKGPEERARGEGPWKGPVEMATGRGLWKGPVERSRGKGGSLLELLQVAERDGLGGKGSEQV